MLRVIGLAPLFVRIDGTLMGEAVSGLRETQAHETLRQIALGWQSGS